MKVLVIPEDFVKDQYMIKPIVTAMLRYLNKPNSIVQVCQNPRLGGVTEALKWLNLEKIIKQYPMVDLFLLLVDRDGAPGRKAMLTRLEDQATSLINNPHKKFLAENAWQELEVWVLAGLDLPKDWQWREIRTAINPKETFFLGFVQQKGLQSHPGEGRQQLGKEAARNYSAIRIKCPEDVQCLEQKINDWIRRSYLGN